jgi:aromatic-L-amino-acid decarboxylase
MSVVCFRCTDAGPDANGNDRLNESIVEAVNASGEAYLTHTRLRGRTAMRVGFGNVLTTEVHVETLWRRIQQERGQLTQV